jgi:hypothetical protein
MASSSMPWLAIELIGSRTAYPFQIAGSPVIVLPGFELHHRVGGRNGWECL